MTNNSHFTFAEISLDKASVPDVYLDFYQSKAYLEWEDLFKISIYGLDYTVFVGLPNSLFLKKDVKGVELLELSFSDTALQNFVNKQGYFISKTELIHPLILREKPVGYVFVSGNDISSRIEQLLKLSCKQLQRKLPSVRHGQLPQWNGSVNEHIINNISDVVYELDQAGCFVFVNKTFTELTGYSAADIIGKHFTEVIVEEERKTIVEYYLHSIENFKSADSDYIEFHIYDKDGSRRLMGQKVRFEFVDQQLIRSFGFAIDLASVQAQREKERMYKMLSENLYDLICVHDLNGEVRFVSNSVEHLLGLMPEELIGGKFDALISPVDAYKYREALAHAYDGDSEIELFEARLRTPQMSASKWFEVRLKPFYDANGKLSGVQSSSRDITSRKNEELKTLSYQQSLDALNAVTSELHLGLDEQLDRVLNIVAEYLELPYGVITEINGITCKIYHVFDQYEEFGPNVGDEFSLEDTYCHRTFTEGKVQMLTDIGNTDLASLPLYQSLKLQTYIGIPFSVDGEVRGTINFVGEDFHDPFNGHEKEFMKVLARLVGFLVERDESKKKLLEEKHTLQTFVQSAPAAVAMLDQDLNYLVVSDQWIQQHALSDLTVEGNCHSVLFDDHYDKNATAYVKSLSGESHRIKEEWLLNAKGEEKCFNWELRPWFVTEKKIGGVMVFAQDITLLKQHQEELREAKEVAESASKVKEDFLAVMSHEIRTPMNAIVGIAQLLIQEEHLDDQKEYLKLLNSASSNLLALTNDILDFGKMEAGKIILESKPFFLKELFDGLEEVHHLAAEEKEIFLNLEYDKNVPEIVIGDSLRITQIVNNLVSNALKFTHRGGVTMHVKYEGAKNGHANIAVRVKDTGIGIAKENQRAIFEVFTQEYSDTTRKYGGSGLGLAITKNLLELMGSEIQLHSELGHGSTFSFLLKLPIAKEGEQPVRKVVSMVRGGELAYKDMRILVVEDNKANCFLMDKFLSRWNFKVEFAFNGLEAVEMVKQETYDLILMDLQMPELDGFAATRMIRSMQDEHYRKVPIVALTANVQSEVRKQVDEAGMNAFLSKPFKTDELIDLIRNFAQVKQNDAQLPIVDKQLLSGKFNEAGIDKALWKDGFKTQGLALVHALICDEYDEFVRSSKVFNEIHHEVNIHAVDAWCKNIGDNFNQLITGEKQKLGHVLNQYVTAMIEFCNEVDDSQGVSSDLHDRFPYLSDVANGDTDLLKEIAGYAMDVVLKDIEKFEQSVLSHDFATASRMAHTIKPNIISLGSESLGATAKDLEKLFKSDQPKGESWKKFVLDIKKYIAEIVEIYPQISQAS